MKKKGKIYMLTDYDREIAICLVEALVDYGLNDHLAQYGPHSTESWFWNNNLRAAGFGASGGASKVCIWHSDLDDWVIKVGYTEKVKFDYATVEYEMYCKAAEAGLGHYFPQTVFLGNFGGRAFYLQQYAECSEDAVSSDWYERLRDQYDEDGEEYDPDTLWDAIDCMDDDEKAFLSFHDNALCNFLWSNEIGDLHEGNFGYINGCMVIVDFSGWKG